MLIMISEITIMIMMIRVVIRAAVNIKKGEHISINYSDPMWGTCNRQIHLGERRDVDHGDHHGINDHMMITPCGGLATGRFII